MMMPESVLIKFMSLACGGPHEIPQLLVPVNGGGALAWNDKKDTRNPEAVQEIEMAL